MKLSEAKKIIGTIYHWQLCHMEVLDKDEIGDFDLTPYSLSDLIKANNLVKSNNSRKQKLQQYYAKRNGKSKGISQQIVLDDRLIAATYTALHYKPSMDSICQIDNRYTFVVQSK